LSGTYDVGEPFYDCNNNLVFDTGVVAEPYQDVNGNGRYDRFATPATSDTLLVSAVDRNLNRLSAAATYQVTKPTDSKVKVSYNGLPALADGLGFWFGYRACNTATPTPSCASECSAVSLGDGLCTLKTVITDYDYGYVTSVTFTGGAVGESDGGTQVFWEITLAPWTLQIPVPGTHQ
jgi:hypothetical protein